MLVYCLTLVGFVALIGSIVLQRAYKQRARACPACAYFRSCAEAFFVAGVIFSAIQLLLAFSNIFEATSRTISAIDVQLAKYKTITAFLTIRRGPESLLAIIFVVLLLVPFAIASDVTVVARAHRFPHFMKGYVIVTLVTSLMLFSAMTARQTLAPRVAVLERHVQRIEDDYGKVLEEAGRRMDRELTSVAIEMLKHDDQWLQIHSIWFDLVKDLDHLPHAYPDLFAVPHRTDDYSETGHIASLLPLPDYVAPLPARAAAGLSLAAPTERQPMLIGFGRRFGGERADGAEHAYAEIPLSLRWQFLDDAISSTYENWSEDGAAGLQQELDQDADVAANNGTLYVIDALTHRIGGALYEAETQPVTQAAEGDWTALPSSFLRTFLQIALSDGTKAQLEAAANRQLIEWLEGRQEWRQTAAGYRDEIRPALSARSANARRLTERKFRAAVQRASDEYALAHDRLTAEVQRYADLGFARRWPVLEQTWTAGVAGLSPSAKISAMDVLARIGAVLRLLPDPMARMASLGKLEDAWRGIDASDQNAQSALTVAAPAIIVSESVALRSRQFARDNEAEILHIMTAALLENFERAVGRPPKPSEGYKLDSELRTIFADPARFTAAAAGRLSQHADAGQNAERWIPGWQACMIQGAFTTTSYFAEPALSRVQTPVSIPCW